MYNLIYVKRNYIIFVKKFDSVYLLLKFYMFEYITCTWKEDALISWKYNILIWSHKITNL